MKIDLSHLPDGHHEYQLTALPDELEFDADSPISQPVEAWVTLEKRGGDYFVDLNVASGGEFVCDRCGDPFALEVADKSKVLFTDKKDLLETDNEVRFQEKGSRELDLSEEIRQVVLLSVPAKLVCRKGCKGLCARCGANLNEEQCQCESESIDPRWEALKKLKTKD